MKIRAIALLVAVALSTAWVVAQEALPVAPGQAAASPQAGAAAPGAPAAAPSTDARHYSYALGLDLGTSFRNDKLPLDVESVMAGVRDGLEGKDPKFSMELCAASIERLAAERTAAMQRRNKAMQQRSKEYLVENAKVEGVQTTPSGLQYKVLKSGDGATPTAEDTVKVHYRGQFVDGTVFDESYGGEPASLALSGPRGVIPGWVEALEKMKVGDKWQLVVPSDLGYGEQGYPGAIPPNATLIFEIELLGIEGK
jgi:FKBP-type peptidyl-prolyl cis-trans isomerase FklB